MSSLPPSPTAPEVQHAEIVVDADTQALTVVKQKLDCFSTAIDNQNTDDSTCIPGHPDFVEYILRPNPKRFVLFPVQHEDMYQMYTDSVANFWVPGELDLEHDIKDWDNKLTEDERYFIQNVLGFFAASDGVVNENLAQRFATEVQLPEARAFYNIQIAIEQIHSHTYSLLLDTYIKNPVEKDRMFNAIETVPSIGKKAAWAMKWITSSDSFAERLLAFMAVEGIFFSGSFCSIFWLKKRSLMPGLCQSNELISRDEGMHCEFACLLYGTLEDSRLSQARVHEIISEAVEIEKEFITEALPCALIGMNSTTMKQYICYVADFWLTCLGYAKLYNVQNPYEWMVIGYEDKANFFERKVTNYQKAGMARMRSALTKNANSSDASVPTTNNFSTNEDF